MLKKRIIPTILWDGVQVVKPVAFERPYRKLGTIEQYMMIMEARNVDEILIIDICATEENREPKYDKFRGFTSNLMCPISYAGGINSLDCIQRLLANGADKVGVKTNNEIIYPAARKFGSQAIISIVDYNLGEDVILTCKNREADGAGEILLTCMDLDGRMEGYDLETLYDVSSRVSIPVVALGGAESPEDLAHALQAGASAVSAGSLFLFTEHTPKSCAEYLNEQGFPVRL